MTDRTDSGGRAVRFFFMQIGSLPTVVLYFIVYGASGYSEPGLHTALLVALVVQTAYIALARSQGELKQFDLGFWLLFAIGEVGFAFGVTPLIGLYRLYSPALVFLMLGLTAALPPLFGYDWFTVYFTRRTLPEWQQKLPVTARLGRLLGAFWALLFFAAAVIAAAAPLDWKFTTLYPNLLVLGVGLTMNWLLPAAYLKVFPPEPPATAEAAIMGMPFVFDSRAARAVRAEIQFRVSGDEPGDYWLRIANGHCESFTGEAPNPAVTIYTPASVWMRIVGGELDGENALIRGLYRVAGDTATLANLPTWFPAGSR